MNLFAGQKDFPPCADGGWGSPLCYHHLTRYLLEHSLHQGFRRAIALRHQNELPTGFFDAA